MSVRKIFKNATTSHVAVQDVLTLIFTQELLIPSGNIFIVAPWISDIPILDNRQGGFMALNPEWPRGDIRLPEVLAMLATLGARIHVHVGPSEHNRDFEIKLKEALADSGVSSQCYWKEHAYLHTKGILTDNVFVSGSMNFTRNGTQVLDEFVEVSYSAEAVALAHTHFQAYEEN